MSDAAAAAPKNGADKKNTAPDTDLFADFKSNFEKRTEEKISLVEYLELCKTDPLAYATPAERLQAAAGEPREINTREDERLANIFQSRTIQVYDAFSDFYGMEDVIMALMGHIKHASQGLEEAKQILYFLGPVGGGKSSLSDRVVELMEQNPIYVLRHKESGETSPVFENPLGLFGSAVPEGDIHKDKMRQALKDKYGIDQRYIRKYASPWANKRLEEAGGDLNAFEVVKMYPSKVYGRAIAQVEPGDENNQDVSTITGKVDIRKLEEYKQNDPDAYNFSGGLNKSNEGVLLFEEMFKAPIDTLTPLLGATQNRNYQGTEEIGPIPYDGKIIANSNEGEWEQFSRDKTNEAMLDRVDIIKVPYCLRMTDEVKIYEKILQSSELAEAPAAPQTLEILAKFAVMSRLKVPSNSDLYTKMRVYDGENLKDEKPSAKSIKEYKDLAAKDGRLEGMDGISTRWAYKVMSATFNDSSKEIAADPIVLFKILHKHIDGDDKIDQETKGKYKAILDDTLKVDYLLYVEKEIKKAYLESYEDYGQNIFDRYIAMADAWIDKHDMEDPDTGVMLNREALDTKLKAIEKASGISNVTDFRNEISRYASRYREKNNGENPKWHSYKKMQEVIESKMFQNINDMLPVISFGSKASTKDQEKHEGYLERMKARGYTDNQVRRITEWFVAHNDHS